jgi:hypothetical protein
MPLTSRQKQLHEGARAALDHSPSKQAASITRRVAELQDRSNQVGIGTPRLLIRARERKGK